MNVAKLSKISFEIYAKTSEEFFSQIFLLNKLVFDHYNQQDVLEFSI